MTTTYNLDIIDVIDTRIKEFSNLIKDEKDYLENGGEGTELVRFDHIRKWEDKIDELVKLKKQVSYLLNQ